MTDKPITNGHIEFAHALVALAREHGADDLKVEFRLSGPTRMDGDWSAYDPTRLSFQWHSGRHGDRTGFTLRAEASVEIDERPEPPAEQSSGMPKGGEL
jgi:hypothetical protein